MTERLQKLIARSGLCSRRAAEELLTSGRVRVNGRVAQLGEKADGETDRIEVDGQLLESKPAPVYLMLNKPRGYVTTLSDEYGRKTAAELVADCGVRVFPVGRLDRDSEGLLLFTNDGAWMQRMLHPSHEINKVYLVTVKGRLRGAAQRLASIRDLDGEPIHPAAVKEIQSGDGQAVLQVTIHEGKNRQIRRMCAMADLDVLRLQRVQEDHIHLGDLDTGKWRYLTDIELKALEGSDIRDK